MTYEKDKKQLAYSILAVVVAFTVYKICGMTILPRITDKIVRTFTGECIFTAATVVAAIVVKKIGTLKPTWKGLGKGFLLGWPMIAVVLMGFSVWVSQLVIGSQNITVSGGKVVMLVIASLLVGVAEELLIRGIHINGLLDYYGKTTASSIRKAVIISALVFGALHIFNVLSGVTFMAAFIQAVNATFLGIIFGAIYIRTGKNLWPCIIIHAVWDFNGFINGGMLAGKGIDDTINGATFEALKVSVFFVALAFFYLRNKKIKEFEEN